MIILIDGYNVMKHVDGDRFIKEPERTQFIHLMGRYGNKKKHKLMVVFDGGDSSWPHKESIGKVTVIYSGFKQTADSVIMDYIEEHRTKDLLLVSSDRELNHFASQHDVVSIGSEEFYYLVRTAIDEKNDTVDAVIEIDEESESLDEIMEKASQEVPLKAEDIREARTRKKQQYSKQDRELLKKLKKL